MTWLIVVLLSKFGSLPRFTLEAKTQMAVPGLKRARDSEGPRASRYHLVTKVMVIWINENILKGTSFIQFSTDARSADGRLVLGIALDEHEATA